MNDEMKKKAINMDGINKTPEPYETIVEVEQHRVPSQTENSVPEVEEEGEGYLDVLDRQIYSRNKQVFKSVHPKLKEKLVGSFGVPVAAAASAGSAIGDKAKEFLSKAGGEIDNIEEEDVKRGFSFFSVGFLSFSIILLLGAVLYAYFSLVKGGQSVKQTNIGLENSIPTFTNSGSEMKGAIKVSNSNRATMKNTYLRLLLEKEDGEPIRELPQIEVGDLLSGEGKEKTFDLVVQGREGDVVRLRTIYYYSIDGSTSVFEKRIENEIKVTKSPLILDITGPKSISLGQDGEYRVSVRGGEAASPNTGLKLVIPSDVKVLDSSLKQISRNLYSLGNVLPGEEKVVTFTISFKENPEIGNVFEMKAEAGPINENQNNLEAVVSESAAKINLQKNPLSIKVFSEGEYGEKVFFSSKQPKVKVLVRNESGETVKDAKIEIALGGGMLNPRSVSVSSGIYDASIQKIKLDENNTEQLKEFRAGSELTVDIQFQDLIQTNVTSRRIITIDSTVSALLDNTGNLPSVVRSNVAMVPKESTYISAKTLYFSGPFKNEGAMPAKVGQKTTYTITLGVETASGITRGKYSVVLPNYVEFVRGMDSDVEYNKNSRTVVWSVGTVSKTSGALIATNKKETSIQVSILPTPDQTRQAPPLTNGIKLEAVSSDNKTNISLTVADVNIQFLSDPKYERQKGYESVE